MKIGIIGVGNLGYSIALGILNQEAIRFTSLYLSKRNVASLHAWSELPRVSITSDNIALVKKSEIIIIAVQPGQLKGVLEEIKPYLISDKHTIISVVTGRKIAQIAAVLGEDHALIRCMPNTAISVGQSMTCLSANEKGIKKIEFATVIFGALGKTMCVEEELMQAATVICASGIAFWMRLIRATTQGAIQLGFDAAEAQELSVQTCLGAASLLKKSESHPEAEIDKVTTPRGCTISGLNEMEHEGLSSALIKGLVASFNKINQI
ncbi:MAG: pyrroline-5-carboxylate reductase [Flavobacteriaceae bacterium]|nr:pyrroline-5-carboxylate reductase [Flavobacteriaceae bacterium]